MRQVSPGTTPGRTGPGTGVRTVLAVLVLGAALGAVATARHGPQTRDAQAGQRAFEGSTPLAARIEGHETALPPTATACANCHRPAPQVATVAGSAPAAAAFGPRLHRALLTEPVARRGGPPSRYDPASFCRLLRTGEDPAGVLLPRAMPRYELDDAACAQLWQHLLRVAP